MLLSDCFHLHFQHLCSVISILVNTVGAQGCNQLKISGKTNRFQSCFKTNLLEQINCQMQSDSACIFTFVDDISFPLNGNGSKLGGEVFKQCCWQFECVLHYRTKHENSSHICERVVMLLFPKR